MDSKNDSGDQHSKNAKMKIIQPSFFFFLYTFVVLFLFFGSSDDEVSPEYPDSEIIFDQEGWEPLSQESFNILMLTCPDADLSIEEATRQRLEELAVKLGLVLDVRIVPYCKDKREQIHKFGAYLGADLVFWRTENYSENKLTRFVTIELQDGVKRQKIERSFAFEWGVHNKNANDLAYWSLSIDAYQKGAYEQALDFLDQMEMPSYLNDLAKAQCAIGLGDHEAAQAYFVNSINLHPKELDVYSARAYHFQRMGSYDRALTFFSIAVNSGASASRLMDRAQLHEAMGNYQAALEDLSKAQLFLVGDSEKNKTVVQKELNRLKALIN